MLELQAALFAREGIPPDEQRLVFAGKQLRAAATLQEVGIQAGAEVRLMLTLKGRLLPSGPVRQFKIG